MFERLEGIERKFQEIERKLASQEILKDPGKFKSLAKERAELEPIVSKFRQYKSVLGKIKEAKEILKEGDKELRELAEEELRELNSQLKEIEKELKFLLLPKDPNDERNVILEIRAGAGGEEAALFVGDLFRMYTRYAERKGWKTEILDSHPSSLGGFKEVVVLVKGKGAYSRFKFESGVHRVQRVPVTETGGRIHTSTATVAVLPEADEIDVKIDPKDLRIEAFGASGPGGQNVNRNYTAIRITHLPTGIVVSCQDEKSQHRNKEKAMKILRARLYELERKKQQEAITQSRRAQVGSGERSEKIRTYNFPQNRVSDHRINYTVHNLEAVLDGELDEIIDRLIANYQAEKLKEKKLA